VASVLVWLLLYVIGGVSAFHLGKYYGLYLVYKAEKAGRIAVVRLPSKKELEGLVKKAKEAVGMQPASKPKTDLLN